MKVFLTGANRGIGLEFVRQLLSRGDTVFAAARKPDEATELQALKNQYPDTLIPLQIDLIDDATIAAASETVRQHTDSLDLIINNAAINPPGEFQKFGALDSQRMLFMLHVNSVAPLMIVQQLIDLLKAGNNPKVVNVSSQVGSFDWKRSGGSYGYAPSKSALNMVTNLLGYDLKPMGITAITTHPGWVQTDMGGPNASLTPEESVSSLIKLIDGLTLNDAGKFYKWNGEIHEW